MRSDRFFSLILFLLVFGFVSAQPNLPFIWPIDSSLMMTGNYGELRPNHFHTGIDFSTGGKLNLPVKSVAEGYISRIRVSAYGYGKCVYITHPNGKVSVYAHLNSFSIKVANLAKKNQYDLQSFEIDFYPKPRSVYVRKNEIIGLSGNTGGSTGPHLHFELRDEKTEIPVNPLSFYKWEDKLPPYLEHIAFFDLSDTTSPKFMFSKKVKNYNDFLLLDDDHILLDNSIIGLSYSGFDRSVSKGNTNNIYATKVYCNDTLIYSHELSSISFADSRYVNEFCEKVGKDKFQKCFLPTIYPDNFYGTQIDKGCLNVPEDRFQKIKIEIRDEAGNKSDLIFYIKAKKKNSQQKKVNSGNILVNCNENFTYSKNKIQIYIPARTLYHSIPLIVDNTLENTGKIVVLPKVNLAQAVQLGFVVPEKYFHNREKLVLRSESNNYMPTNRNDSVLFSIKEFDEFHLTLDTIPPKIKLAQSKSELKEAWKLDSFSFQISDNLSGIGKYNVWLNNAWVLAEFDSKTDLLTYYFDEDTPMGILNFKVEVTDKVGNKTYFDYELRK